MVTQAQPRGGPTAHPLGQAKPRLDRVDLRPIVIDRAARRPRSTPDDAGNAGTAATGADGRGTAPPTAAWLHAVLGGTGVDLLDERSSVELILRHATSRRLPPLGVMSANLDHIYHFGSGGTSRELPFCWAHEDGGPAPSGLHHRPDRVRWLCLLDGAPVVSRADALTGGHWPRLSGSDLIDPLLDEFEYRDLSVAFLGGTQETHLALHSRLAQARPGLRVVGLWAPGRAELSSNADSARIASMVRDSGADVLIVGLGKPRQERWITDHGVSTGAQVLLAFGAVVDFLAGRVRRAPEPVTAHGLEWAWRLALEPRRLARRYLIQGPRAYRVLRRDSHVAGSEPAALGVGTARKPDGHPPATPDFAGPHDDAELAVVVVTYNNAADIESFVGSLRQEARDVTMRVVVIDNGSTDATVDLLAQQPDLIARRAPSNLGYAGGINLALEHAKGVDAVCVLNPDLAVFPGALKAMLARLWHPGVGVVAPTLLDGDGRIYPSLRREPSPLRALGDAFLGSRVGGRPAWLSEIDHDHSHYAVAHAVDWATGAALVIRSEVLAAVGPWDEQYFLYSEETDYCRRVRDGGWSVWYEPAAQMRHSRGGSGSSPEFTALMQVNRVRYARTHGSRAHAAAIRTLALVGSLLRPHDRGHRAAALALCDSSRWAQLARPAPPAEVSDTTDYPRLQGSVVIPAHNESAVIARTLAPLARAAAEGDLDVVVVCNGCTDDTAAVARRFSGVHVAEIDVASKPAALRMGDRLASRWPRLYLDADIDITERAVADTLSLLEQGVYLAARPRAQYETGGAPTLVRSYFRAREKVPALHTSLWGGGAYALSRAGHDRLGDFPDVMADDLWVDGWFSPAEKRVVDTTPLVVHSPKDLPGLQAILRRTARGNRLVRAQWATTLTNQREPSTARTARGLLRTVRGPRSAFDACVYAVLVALARLQSRSLRTAAWERDHSSRRATAEGSG